MITQRETSMICLKKSTQLMRIYSLDISEYYIKKYSDAVSPISIRELELIPYLRFLTANELEKIFQIKRTILKILTDYQTSAVMISPNSCNSIDEECYLKLSTAISHLLGIPNTDPLSGKYYSTFTIKHTDDPLPNLLRPYEVFKMHTDGAYEKKPPDWIMLTKLSEESAVGGESRLLHIDDWTDFNYFYSHAINQHALEFFSTPESISPLNRYVDKEKNHTVHSSVLRIDNDQKSIRFVDRFISPKSLEEAKFIFDLQQSLEHSDAIMKINIPVGGVLILNNHYWLHGRNRFEANNMLSRKLMRQRGYLT